MLLQCFFSVLFFSFFLFLCLLLAQCLVLGVWVVRKHGKAKEIYIYIYILILVCFLIIYMILSFFFCFLGVNYFGPIFPPGIVYTKPTAFWHEFDHSNLTPSLVGDRFELPPLDSIGSVMGWAQTRPKPTRGHPFKLINPVNKPISNEPINL